MTSHCASFIQNQYAPPSSTVPVTWHLISMQDPSLAVSLAGSSLKGSIAAVEKSVVVETQAEKSGHPRHFNSNVVKKQTLL